MNNRIISVIHEYLSLRGLLMFFSLIAAWPCVFYLLGYLPDYRINIVILLLLSLFYIIINLKKLSSIPKAICTIIFVHIFTWLAYSIIHLDSSYFTRIVYIITAVLVLLIDTKSSHPIFVRLFVFWVTIQGILSAIGFVLCLADLIQPISTFEEMDGRPGYNFGFFTTNVYLGQFVRPSGFYDEAGALACWGIYAMVLNKIVLKYKKVEIILTVTLVSTLSIAYFIQVVIYYFLFYRKKIKQLLVISVSFILLLSIIVSQDDAFYDAIVGRFEFDKTEGTISGDNRSDLRKNAKKIFITSPLFGVGARVLSEKYSGINSNEFTFLACDGILGYGVSLLPYFFILFPLGRKNKEIRYGGIVLVIGLLQRPFEFTQLMFPLVVYNTLNMFYNIRKNE